MSKLTDQPYWTAADQAELQLLVHELVDGHDNHQQGCPTCRNGEPCRPLRDAIAIVVEWRERRVLHSQAAWLRAVQNIEDAA
jgi:hypothetical protein